MKDITQHTIEYQGNTTNKHSKKEMKTKQFSSQTVRSKHLSTICGRREGNKKLGS